MPVVSSVSFSDVSAPSSTGVYGSSPNQIGRGSAQVTPVREGVIPLGAAKTIAALSSRRGVNFSPSNDTKYFLASDSILPLKDAPPPSVRAYPDPPSSEPIDQPPSTPSTGAPRSSTPVNSRSILKSRVHDIRLAHSVEEGTLNNKEPARLLVCGKRPRLMARDSFQLAMLQGAAGEGSDTGKAKTDDDMPVIPSSDDSVPDDLPSDGLPKEGSSEMDEEVEETGPLSTSSLVSIILDGAEDLLTLEEAYAVLTTNLRARIPADIRDNEIPPIVREEINLAVTAIREESPAMVRAMLRDLQRILGKVPSSEVSTEADQTPFRGLMPLRDTTPTHKSRLTPTSTPTARRIVSPDGQPTKKGYNEAEVRYRRETAGVGSATLKFLALALHTPVLIGCFTDADTTGLLEQVMAILRTPSLPTPNPKRTFYTSLTIIAQMRVSAQSVLPVKEKIARALESALSDGQGGSPTQSPGAKDNNGQIKKEAFIAVTNLVSTYPSLFFPHYAEFLPACLRGLHSPAPLFRNKAAAAIAAFATAKVNLLADTSSKDTWTKNKAIAQKMENFVVSHLKSTARMSQRTMIHANAGEKRTEWLELERTFKDTVGTAEGVTWACATWANVVCLIGSAFATSGLATSFNHIMDRSLQPSTNIVRPLLARVAWSHAIYAYMTAGAITSITDGFLVSSYKPFPQNSSGDHSERIEIVNLCVDLSMSLAAADSAKIVVTGEQCSWERPEKTKKAKWMCQTGLGAAAVVYAYSGTALSHQEQPAKELTAIFGLPSSDGVPMSEQDKEDAKLDRLDKVWTRVVFPLLQKYGGLRGVDRLKVHGWAIMDAITSVQTDMIWTLDRLLSTKYLSGEVFAADKADKEEALTELLDTLERGPIRAADIPSWGTGWIASRVDKLLDVYQEMLSGIHGIAEVSIVKWQRDHHGNNILPTSLYKIWTNLLRAVASLPSESSDYQRALNLINRHLVLAFTANPSTRVPLSALRPDGTCKTDPDTLRLGMFDLLSDAAMTALGRDAFGATRLPREEAEVDAKISDLAFGADSTKASTMAGLLLGQILHTQLLTMPMQESALVSFNNIVTKLLKAGCVSGFSGKLLGDITNQMPFLFQEHEELQLVVWRQLALRWVEVIDLQPAVSINSTNHTGALLVSLLSCPFRGRQVDSAWHRSASKDDFAAWQTLLKVTVLRFRARGVGSNLGVLESLAAHLGDFLEAGPKTSSTTITLSCLDAAMGYLTLVEPQAHHANHFSISENYIPIDFLTLVSNALLESYPTPESLVQENGQVAISPAVPDLLSTIETCLRSLPVELVWSVVSCLQDGLAVWMQDEAKLVKDEHFSDTLDRIYTTILSILGDCIAAGHLPASAETMDGLIQLFAPRLSRAQSIEVPMAFKAFYEKAFSTVQVDDLSETVKAFLEDVLAAVPGMIEVPGLLVKDTFSQEESQEKYPHAYTLASVPKEDVVSADVLVDTTEADITIDLGIQPASAVNVTEGDISFDIMEDYDADVSQSQFEPVQAPLEKGKKRAVPTLSPIVSEGLLSDDIVEESIEESMSEPQPTNIAPEDDVFGPTNLAVRPRERPKKTKKRGSRSRPLGDAESLPTKRIKTTENFAADPSHSLPTASVPPLVPTTPDRTEEDEEDCILVSNSPIQKHDLPSVIRNSHSRSSARNDLADDIADERSLRRSSSGIRPGLLDSARNWIAGVFNKSPTTPTFSSHVVVELDSGLGSEAKETSRNHRKSLLGQRSASAVSTDTITSNEPEEVERSESLKSARELQPADTVSSVSTAHSSKSGRRSKRRGGRGTSSHALSPSIEILTRTPEWDKNAAEERPKTHLKRIMVDEEDELLLSPETARKRRREEEGDIASRSLSRQQSHIASPVAGTPVANAPVSLGRRTRSRTKISESQSQPEFRSEKKSQPHPAQDGHSQSQSQSGRFDDAEETQEFIQKIQSIPPTPAQRPTRQARLLKMIKEASEASEIIEGMDLEGVLSFGRYLDKMRGSVQANLERRAIAEKAHRAGKCD